MLELIGQMPLRRKQMVGLGLGPGRATLDFSRCFSSKLRSTLDVPKLSLHAITAGAPTRSPRYAPISFFNLFPRDYVERYVGLFAETILTRREFEEIKQRPGIVDAFDLRDEIDVAITSFGDISHECDLFRWFLKQSKVNVDELIRDEGWLGNVQYRPYSQSEPIIESDTQKRVPTLFELDDFVEMASKGRRHVILLARSCGHCGQARTGALRPLLQNARLKVWSRLVIDMQTARELLADDQ